MKNKSNNPQKQTVNPVKPQTDIGFPPFVGSDPKTLILGEFPGKSSLATRQLCAHCSHSCSSCTTHPCTGKYYEDFRNSFRDIIAKIYNCGTSFSTYDQFLKCLDANNIALWDVYSTRTYLGKILISQTLNDLGTFLNVHPSIQKIVFNGSEAEKVFKNLSIPFTGKIIKGISTSGRTNKSVAINRWKQILP